MTRRRIGLADLQQEVFVIGMSRLMVVLLCQRVLTLQSVESQAQHGDVILEKKSDRGGSGRRGDVESARTNKIEAHL